MAKPLNSRKQKISIATALLLFVATPFLVIFGTVPLAEALPCVETVEWFTNRPVCEPNTLQSLIILLVTPIVGGSSLILIAVSLKR